MANARLESLEPIDMPFGGFVGRRWLLSQINKKSPKKEQMMPSGKLI